MSSLPADFSDDEEESEINPYADPNYPDLEFVNYDDPDYSSGLDEDEMYDVKNSNYDNQGATTTEEELEAMREDRRRRNDEYQFQTYWTKMWGAGASNYHGEWTVYYSTAFLDQEDYAEEEDDAVDGNGGGGDNDSLVRLVQISNAPMTVISKAVKEYHDNDTTRSRIVSSAATAAYDVTLERIVHVEQLAQPMDDADLAAATADVSETRIMAQTYWPSSLRAADFRGPQGIMVCGK